MAKLIDKIGPESSVVVVGLGKSGLAAVELLKKMGVRVKVSEGAAHESMARETLQTLEEHRIFVETGGHTADFICDADVVVVSPGVPLALPPLVEARNQNIPIIGELALAAQMVTVPIIAITGTNGKSTVTELTGSILRAAGHTVFVGGNIGTPLSRFVVEGQNADMVVLEVSSFQLDTALDFRPHVAVLLNITPDHLDRYESYEHYIESKFSIFKDQSAGDFAIVNGNDPEIMPRMTRRPPESTALLFGCPGRDRFAAKCDGGRVDITPGGQRVGHSYNLADTPFVVPPNIDNAMAAILASEVMGCVPVDIMAGVRSFRKLAHRLQFVREMDDIVFYDDSKATNIGAVRAALAGMDRPVVLIAGGRDKGGDYGYLSDVVAEKVKAMVLIGEAGDLMADAFEPVTRIIRAASMEEAVTLAHDLAEQGDAVLLSPACASFDMFSSYGQRGDTFRAAVQQLKKKDLKIHRYGECVKARDRESGTDSLWS